MARRVAASVGRCRFTVSKPVLKALKFPRSKFEHHKLLSIFALNFNLRRYISDVVLAAAKWIKPW